ncbi:cytochrome c oxidase subunit I [Indioceanicola profundi]|uniref:cytochrome c oxidase subunit I n=1 Tax=Indioceanicola profundi TaxID=2220096 RepID=UPI000E6AB6B7|nr:cytochrome c oxidase subunit I [Indioceanicola profundi]
MPLTTEQIIAAQAHRPEDPLPALEEMERAWAQPKGWRALSEVNNTFIGQWYIVTGLIFLILGGVLAIMIRTQLAIPENDFLTGDKYNQVFTLHGSTMMFLFAVPIMEAVAVYILPLQMGARDLPFPRLSAYGFWCYVFGGFISYSSIFFWVAPHSGWFLYPPLSSKEFSAGINNDFWLLGIGFIEISAIAQVVEVTVGVMKTRAPGMSIDRIPIYSWYILVTALMIAFAFPALILGDILLELERAMDWPFFDADRGGDPLLWQHLFWLFGHPEVYIIFLPAAGLVSTMIPTFARVPLTGYTWIVLAAVTTGFLSFGLWVHHMFATGIPHLSLSFFSAASMAVAIPSGIQVFAWIATIWAGKPVLKLPMLYLLGFLFVFVGGGLTGVMVASVPFDWQVHDSYFVVAHLHYVLIGGMVFPLLAAIIYYMPLQSGRMMSERLGKWSFWLIFLGFNITFFPMHIMGLLGMPRRIYTYPAEFGWDWLNLISSFGSYMLAAGFTLFFWDLVAHFRTGRPAGRNPWGAGTLEWATELPTPQTGFQSLPFISGHYPLWSDPDLPGRISRREGLLPTSPEAKRETLRTSTVDARPEQVLRLPHPTFKPLIAAVFTAVTFIVAIWHLWWVSLAGAVLMLAALLAWAWQCEELPAESHRDIGHGIVLPYRVTGPSSHAWWAAVIMVLVDGAAYVSLVFAYFYLWTVSPAWPPLGGEDSLSTGLAVLTGVAAVGAGLLGWLAVRMDRMGATPLVALFAGIGGVAALGVFIPGTLLLTSSGLEPTVHTYNAVVWVMVCFPLAHLGISAVMLLLTAAKAAVRPKGWGWSLTAECTMIWTLWSAAQMAFSLAVIVIAPDWL